MILNIAIHHLGLLLLLLGIHVEILWICVLPINFIDIALLSVQPLMMMMMRLWDELATAVLHLRWWPLEGLHLLLVPVDYWVYQH